MYALFTMDHYITLASSIYPRYIHAISDAHYLQYVRSIIMCSTIPFMDLENNVHSMTFLIRQNTPYVSSL